MTKFLCFVLNASVFAQRREVLNTFAHVSEAVEKWSQSQSTTSLTLRLKHRVMGEGSSVLSKNEVDALVDFLAGDLFWPIVSGLTTDIASIESYVTAVGDGMCSYFDEFDLFKAESFKCVKAPRKWTFRALESLKRLKGGEKELEKQVRNVAIENPDLFDSLALGKVLYPLPRLPGALDQRLMLEILGGLEDSNLSSTPH